MEIIYDIDDFPNPGDRDIYRGIQEINKGDYQEAQKCFEKGKRYNNEYASLFNTIHYYTGFGFEKRDPLKSTSMLKKITLKWNNAIAQYLIGVMYFEGDKDIARHEKFALEWLSLAAKNNWTDAMVLLGYGYQDGNLLKQDGQKAVSWYRRVEQKDDKETELIDDDILYLFENKEFELRLKEPDIISLIRSTVDHNIPFPTHYLNISGRPAGPESDKIFQTTIWSLFTSKKSRGVVISQLAIGIIYGRGTAGILPDAQKSNYFLKKAVKNGSGDACMVLALGYEKGISGVQDYEEAVKWYKRALELNEDLGSAYRIGMIYYGAEGIKSNYKLALHYFRLTVSQTNSGIYHGDVYFFMGDIYEKGKDGVPQDYILARQHYEKAFDCGEVRAAVSIAKLYKNGLGVRKDIKKAEGWMMKVIIAESI